MTIWTFLFLTFESWLFFNCVNKSKEFDGRADYFEATLTFVTFNLLILLMMMGLTAGIYFTSNL